MWHQELQLQDDTENNRLFLSFAKRSREVQRRDTFTARAPALNLHRSSSSSSSSSQYGEEFWEKILSYPSTEVTQYDLCCGDPVTRFSREPAEMVWTGTRGVKNKNLSVNTLPSPAQLMGRRKKGRGRVPGGDAAQRQAAAVTQHIEELRRKQSAIEQMKEDKQWGSMPGYSSENSCPYDVGTLTSPETLWSSDRSLTHSHYTSPSPTHLNTGTVKPQVFGGCKEMMDLVPGGNPMMSFVVTGTAHREAERSWDSPCLDMVYVDTPPMDTPYLHTPCPSHTDFWDFPSII
ncbi:uncharacterized protein LOC113635328 isoform X1 [Tachysurus fulvidraco]|uniref:uncharacterized protein LOC113635328 isoform X1 n=1 Tax=Tachysurus fulvidraco TaxID=1234273 RepID=UPI001FEDA68A|nr:uncharacterized protein LOC113635328 isoform X1 [Tachysurus fulvidraco]